MSRPITVFAPATVGNVACGFDVVGLALEAPGDRVTVVPGPPGEVALADVTGDGGRLPREPDRNTATVAAAAVLEAAGSDRGVELRLEKGLPLAAGMGGSAASAVAAAVATDALLESGLPREVLLRCALEGERAATGAAHPDNAAPSLFGGIVLTLGQDSPHVVQLPIPEGLSVALLHPHLEVETASARADLGDTVALGAAVTQWGNVAGFVAGLYREDWELLARTVVDVVAEPARAHRVPGFEAVKTAAREAGALGASLSGAGPSIFALCKSATDAASVGAAMAVALDQAAPELEARLHLSPVSWAGARILDDRNPGYPEGGGAHPA